MATRLTADFEWESGHIILLILQLKRLNFASNIAVGSNTPIFGTLIYKLQQAGVAYPQWEKVCDL